jgi:molybdenum cofactor cytidylyltransferase
MNEPSQHAGGDADASGDLHVLVLAAGASTRFGSPKQLVRFNGRPMLHSVLSRAVQVAGGAVTVVLGANAEAFAPLLRHSPASVAINRDWARGMSSSIRAGLRQLGGGAGAVLILLADQPAVTTDDLRRLLTAWRRQPQCIAAAQYGGTTGVPAVFPSWCLSELSELRGDRGARGLLQRHADRLVRVPMASAALDIDTPEDLLLVDPAGTTDKPD